MICAGIGQLDNQAKGQAGGESQQAYTKGTLIAVITQGSVMKILSHASCILLLVLATP